MVKIERFITPDSFSSVIMVDINGRPSKFRQLHHDISELNSIGSRVGVISSWPEKSEVYGRIKEYLSHFTGSGWSYGLSRVFHPGRVWRGQISPEFTRGDITKLLHEEGYSPDLEQAAEDTETSLNTLYAVRKGNNLYKYNWVQTKKKNREERFYLYWDFDALE